jgi:FO synthase
MPLEALASQSAQWLLKNAADENLLSRDEILSLFRSPDVPLAALAEIARELRTRGKGSVITYSPKVFLPLTNLCRDRCGYCTFRRDPGEHGARWMEPEEVLAVARSGEAMGCHEALLSLGDRPEAIFPEAAEWLRAHGFRRTLDYVAHISELLLSETSLFPHSNPGLMGSRDLARLQQSNASLGLMLESVSHALLLQGGAHEDAIDKPPHRRLQTIRQAGELKIPFTTGILVGIGESPEEVIDSLFAIRELHIRYGHIQEVIIQNFVPKPEIPMHDFPAPSVETFARTVAIARVIFGGEMNIQAPPNLSPQHLELLLDCGINDWGGVSPVTIDYINPEAPWPQVRQLEALASGKGLRLRERLPVYPEYTGRRDFFAPAVWQRIQQSIGADGFPSSILREARQPQAKQHGDQT